MAFRSYVSSKALLCAMTLVCAMALVVPSAGAWNPNCPNGPAEPRDALSSGIVTFTGKSRQLASSHDVVEVAWKQRNLDNPALIWYQGCRTGRWDSHWLSKAGDDDRLGRSRARFTNLSAPRGRLEVWALIDEWPIDGHEIVPRLTRIGTVYVRRPLPSLALRTEAFVFTTRPPGEQPVDDASVDSLIDAWTYVTTQRALGLKSAVALQRCRAGRCKTLRYDKAEVSAPARVFSDPIERSSGKPFRYEISFNERALAGAQIKLSPAEKQSLRDVIESGGRLRLVSRVTALDSRGSRLDAARSQLKLDATHFPRPGERH